MPKITEMYAYVATDADPDDEGITAYMTRDGWMPLVGSDMERMECLRPIAQQLANHAGKPIKLLKFSVRTEEGAIEPDGSDSNVVILPNGNT